MADSNNFKFLGLDGTERLIDEVKGIETDLNSKIDALETGLAGKAPATHASDTTVHITSTERSDWNAAKTHADSAHAPSNAEKNQNAFSNVIVGSTTIAADSTTDSLTFVAGSNVTITPDATNDKITITIAATDTVYTHPTSSGNKHIPSGGSSGQILRWSADGTAAWGEDSNATYSDATQSASGLMSASDKTKLDGIATGANKITVDSALSSTSTNPVQNKVINTALAGKSDTDHTHKYAGSSSAGGAATSANKINTDAGSATNPVYFANGIPVKTTYTLGASVPSGAKFTDTVYTHPTTSGNKHIPSGGSSGQILRWSADGTAAWGADNNTTYSEATTSAAGLMSAADKTKLDSIGAGTNIPSYWQTELDDGVDAINAAVEAAGRNKSAFLWYTDAHWGWGSGMSPKLLKYLHENTAMNRVNFGGDFCNDYEDPDTGKTEEEWVEVMRGYKRAVRNLPNHHSVIGNHDYNGVNGGIPYVADNLYGLSMAYEETPDIVRGSDYYYYIDEPSEKTRYLYLNTSFCTSLTGSGEAGQGQFVTDALASTPKGWHIVPISHIWFLYADTSTPTVGDVPNYCKALLNLFDAYNNRGSGSITIGSESISYNFADKGGWVEFCIGGHTHVDYDFTSDGGIPVILTATDSYHLRGSSLDPRYLGGTTDESSVSGIIADYGKHKIHVVRIGRGAGRVIEVTNYETGYTNVLKTAGYTENVRLSASSGYTEKTNTGTDLSGYIKVSVGDTIYLKNVTMPDVSSGYSCLVYGYNLDKVGQASTSIPSSNTAANPVYEGGNLVQFTITSAIMGGAQVTEGYIRINASNIDSTSIITVNEPIA